MKEYPNIDYAFRPASYWQDKTVLSSLLRDVKGTERRAMIRAYWRAGRLEDLDENLLQCELSDRVREQLGRIHPMFMGGEYLPGYRGREVEIARIELQSTTSDVISIRARRRSERIRYRIADEYDTRFVLSRKSSARALTLQQLVNLIDGSEHPDTGVGLALCYNEMNEQGTGERRSLRHFARVSSEFYPQLVEHYEHIYDEWVEEWERENAEDEETVEGGEGLDNAG